MLERGLGLEAGVRSQVSSFRFESFSGSLHPPLLNSVDRSLYKPTARDACAYDRAYPLVLADISGDHLGCPATLRLGSSGGGRPDRLRHHPGFGGGTRQAATGAEHLLPSVPRASFAAWDLVSR